MSQAEGTVPAKAGRPEMAPGFPVSTRTGRDGPSGVFRGRRAVTHWKLPGIHRHHLISWAHFTEEEAEALEGRAVSPRSTNRKLGIWDWHPSPPALKL